MSYRFFISPKDINWQEKKATVADYDHTYKMLKVLRLKENDQIILLDGQGLIYNAQISSIYSKNINCRLLSRRSAGTEPNLKITIAQSLLKGSKFDYLLQKNVEIGVFSFVPVACERTVVKIQEEDTLQGLDKKAERYQKIAMDAAEQSERGIVPQVKDLVSLQDLCKSNLANYDLKLICVERSQTNGIKEVLNSLQSKVEKVIVLIGPEGGFTESEVKLAGSYGFTPVSLGKRIFRSETVSVAISSILFFYFNDLK